MEKDKKIYQIRKYMKNIIYVLAVIIFVMGCQGEMKSKIDLNGTYRRNCGLMYKDHPGYLFKVTNDSLVDFYEDDGYDLDKDLKEEYDPKKPLTIKWKLLSDWKGGKLVLIDDTHVVLKVQKWYKVGEENEYSNDTFNLDIDGSLSREEIRTLSDAMEYPNALECLYKIYYYHEK